MEGEYSVLNLVLELTIETAVLSLTRGLQTPTMSRMFILFIHTYCTVY